MPGHPAKIRSLFLGITIAAVSLLAAAGPITIEASRKLHPVNPLMFGTNCLFWVEDDASLADGSLDQALKKIPCRLLRFPGGTVADNYHWKTNKLHNPAMFPYHDGPDETDTDEFIALCKRVGAEPVLVVNTASWVFDGDVAGGAKEAADWVRYCNIEHDYNVRYWEIGNETYWHIVMDAAEYAHLVNAYAKAMKAVDPTIKIGANGHWGTWFVGTKERIKPGMLEPLLDERRRISSPRESAAFERNVKEHCVYPSNTGDQKWWSTVAEICGQNIDMIIVHWYYGITAIPTIQQELTDVEKLFTACHPDKQYLIYMSEHNLYRQADVARPMDYANLIFEAYQQMFLAGVDMAAFWPLRPLLADRPDERALLSSANESRAAGFVLGLLSRNLNGDIVQTQSPDGIPVLAAVAEDRADIFISARQVSEPNEIDIILNDFAIDRAAAAGYFMEAAGGGMRDESIPLQRDGDHIRLVLPPGRLVHVKCSGLNQMNAHSTKGR